MEPIIFTIVTESGARLFVADGLIEVLVSEGKKQVTKQVAVDQFLLCERVSVDGKWELVVSIETPKCE